MGEFFHAEETPVIANDSEQATLWSRYEANKATKMLDIHLPIYARILISVAVMAGLVLAVSSFGLPNPNMILITGLVICSTLFGIPGGLIAAASMVGYTLFFFSSDHDFVTFTPENGLKVLVTLVGVTVVGTFVCALKSAQDRALRDADALASLLKEDNELLEQASATDELTGLRNRFALRRDYPHYANEGRSLHIMMLDLDDFKAINDSHGHGQGDKVLTDVGQVLSDVFGPQHCYRYGGDEFLVIVPEWTDVAFGAACEAMQSKLEELSFGDGEAPVLFSGGYVSGTPLYQTDLRLMIRQADDNLYRAKERGKDQVFGTPFERETAEKLEVDDNSARGHG